MLSGTEFSNWTKICPALLDFAHFQKCANPSQILQFGIRIEDFIQLLGSRNKIFHEVNFDRKARIASLTHATLAWKGVEGVLVFIVVVKIHFLHVKAESPSSWVEALVHTSRTLARKKTNEKKYFQNLFLIFWPSLDDTSSSSNEKQYKNSVQLQ